MASTVALDRAAQAFSDALDTFDGFEIMDSEGASESIEVRLEVEADGQRWCWRRVCREEGGRRVCRMERLPC